MAEDVNILHNVSLKQKEKKNNLLRNLLTSQAKYKPLVKLKCQVARSAERRILEVKARGSKSALGA